MWAVYVVTGYFLLALLIPVVWSLRNTWRYSHIPRQLTCPETGCPVDIVLDPWFAVRQRVIGTDELRVLECSRWPEHRECALECLTPNRTSVVFY
jgi:hypothetical protein